MRDIGEVPFRGSRRNSTEEGGPHRHAHHVPHRVAHRFEISLNLPVFTRGLLPQADSKKPRPRTWSRASAPVPHQESRRRIPSALGEGLTAPKFDSQDGTGMPGDALRNTRRCRDSLKPVPYGSTARGSAYMSTKTVKFYRPVLVHQDGSREDPSDDFWSDAHTVIAGLASKERGINYRAASYFGEAGSGKARAYRYIRVGRVRYRADWPETIDPNGHVDDLNLDGRDIFEGGYIVPFGTETRVAVIGPIRGLVSVNAIEWWLGQVLGLATTDVTLELVPEVDPALARKLNEAIGVSRLSVRMPRRHRAQHGRRQSGRGGLRDGARSVRGRPQRRHRLLLRSPTATAPEGQHAQEGGTKLPSSAPLSASTSASCSPTATAATRSSSTS